MNNDNDTKVEDYSILGWIYKHRIKSEKGIPLDFHDRLFLLDILTDWSPNIAWKKCSQVGGSVVFNLKCFFGLIKRGWNIIYTMPTDGDVEEFAKTKTNPLIRENPAAFESMESESVYLKQANKRNMHMKGTISKSAAISTTADLLVHDEISRSDQPTVKTYESRTKASTFRGKWLFSNPTTEKDALDEEWKESDQKEWYITCQCGAEQEIKWPESLDLDRKCFQCVVCKKALTREERRVGRWIDRDGIPWAGQLDGRYKVSGWHTSHLIAPWITAEDIIKDSDGDQEYFFNFILGEPYNPGDLKVSRATILDNWTPKDLTKGQTWFLGVDVGNIKHYVLGTELGVVKVGRFTKWSDLDDMMAMYKPYLVIDAMPDNTMSKYYVDTYAAALMSYFQDNKANPQVIVWWGQPVTGANQERNKSGVVYSNRNRIIDKMIDEILNARILFGVPSDRDFKDYVKHWETLRRIKEVDAKEIEHYVWESTTGEDHYVFATLYYYLARLSMGSGALFLPDPSRPYEFIDADSTVGDIGEMFERANEQ